MFRPRYQTCYLYLLCVLSLPLMLLPLCICESDICQTISTSVRKSSADKLPQSCSSERQCTVLKIAPHCIYSGQHCEKWPYRTALTQLLLKGHILAAEHVTLTIRYCLQLYHEMSAAIGIPFSSPKRGPRGMKGLLCKLPQRA